MMSFISSAILASSMVLVSLATIPPVEKPVTFEGTLRADSKADHFTVAVHLDIKKGWHICAEPGESSELRTTLELKLPAGVKAIGDWDRPTAIAGIELHSEIYIGKADFSKSVVVDPSAYGKSIEVVVSYQVCTDKLCNPPQTKTISIAIPENSSASESIFESPVRIKADGAPLNTVAKKRFPSPGIFDVDGDGKSELVIGALMGSVGVYEDQNTTGTGDPVWGSRKPLKDAEGRQIRTKNW